MSPWNKLLTPIALMLCPTLLVALPPTNSLNFHLQLTMKGHLKGMSPSRFSDFPRSGYGEPGWGRGNSEFPFDIIDLTLRRTFTMSTAMFLTKSTGQSLQCLVFIPGAPGGYGFRVGVMSRVGSVPLMGTRHPTFHTAFKKAGRCS
ncbi:hypothetical protein C8R42DRAFT_641177 [Lentinula raphanica]|nr:hypothetical protein C8R42DRAFT_641177 [Lentinula raphanica]